MPNKDPEKQKELQRKHYQKNKKNYSEEIILNEMNKCDVLCHNCHAKHHWNDQDRRRIGK